MSDKFTKTSLCTAYGVYPGAVLGQVTEKKGTTRYVDALSSSGR
jgi:hypothetical protein